MQSVNEIWPVYDILQKAYYKKKQKNNDATWKLVPSTFVFGKN